MGKNEKIVKIYRKYGYLAILIIVFLLALPTVYGLSDSLFKDTSISHQERTERLEASIDVGRIYKHHGEPVATIVRADVNIHPGVNNVILWFEDGWGIEIGNPGVLKDIVRVMEHHPKTLAELHYFYPEPQTTPTNTQTPAEEDIAYQAERLRQMELKAQTVLEKRQALQKSKAKNK